jgi:hypothetical protein
MSDDDRGPIGNTNAAQIPTVQRSATNENLSTGLAAGAAFIARPTPSAVATSPSAGAAAATVAGPVPGAALTDASAGQLSAAAKAR